MASTFGSPENGNNNETNHHSSSMVLNRVGRTAAPSMMEQLAMAEGLSSTPTNRKLQRAPNSCDSDVSVTTKSIASSAALVGESIMESPHVASNDNNNMAKRKHHHQQTQHDDATPTNWGISDTMHAGLGWIQRKRQERQQAALEQQVAEQRRILQQAQQEQQAHVHAASIHYSPSGSGMSVNLNQSIEQQEEEQQDEHEQQQEHNDEWDATTVKVRYQVESPEAPPFLLDEKTMQLLLEQALPPAIAYSRWKRIYCLARDGDDFGEFLRKCAPHQYTLLVIQTTFGEIFGGYVESTWTMHSDGFYGLGQACLYTLGQNNGETLLQVYKWTGANRYLQVCDVSNRMICMGGGGDSFGLCLEQDFSVGSTGPCDTFANPALCSHENFQVLNMEVYGFLLGQF